MTTTQSLLDGENKSRYFDRELSWLSFNERVLWQAKSEANPIGEKLRFISISASNLDEFLMVRLAGMYQLQMRGYHRMPETDAQISGLLEAIEAKVTYLLSEQQKFYHAQNGFQPKPLVLVCASDTYSAAVCQTICP